MPNSVPDWDELLSSCRRAAHLEMRDHYAGGGEDDTFAAWQAGKLTPEECGQRWLPFHDEMAAVVARGTQVRRLRLVSTPASEYIRFEHAGTAATIRSGEDVRWLGRRDALDLVVPANDLWVFDERAVVFLMFDGNGTYLEDEDVTVEDPSVVRQVLMAFDTAWARATPHGEFRI
ncbi:DUF6879 family protein [Yinghuangia sp. YIM S09857]|uniref:DUF6879 family protein n=1 Tax=Yinghuangia sp. YIM S09857 TaxID=3436929 RepID=UPI003F52A973